ncbi:TetR/AcrR family transcriptional regulator [Gordonia rhizosphera]|uniref:Putative TetR family transcriptional regulator n=1 Tax=Gordonia rhizosphera NBRC 16068 TaxID=1108045 RepID=K6VAL7_9ACTN|nr:TetR/AcrR family transcriptional regulator [Gordonia rhizosphera]GAB93253.1 putative TetR family transcriptional regulator [Gordonia rhizosphera NBRC 16068]
MRTHGWGGNVPVDDEEAVRRILDATREAIDRQGPSVSLADVARALGVTRQTIYRYFRGTDELLSATAHDATDDFLDRVMQRLRGISEPDRATVEAVLAVLDELGNDRYVGLLLAEERLSLPAVGDVTSEMAHRLAGTMVERLDVDWAGRGFSEADLDDVIDIVLRTVQSLVLDPGTPRRSEEELRRFVDRWMGAAVRSMSSGSVSAARR